MEFQSKELIKIEDKTFDKEKFKEVYEILENFLITQKLSGINTSCHIGNQKGFLYRPAHVINVWFYLENFFQPHTINKSSSFRFSIDPEQNYPSKAVFEISIRDRNFNGRKMMSKLKKLGFTSWDKRVEGKAKNHVYKIYCYKSTNQLNNALEAFAEYLP